MFGERGGLATLLSCMVLAVSACGGGGGGGGGGGFAPIALGTGSAGSSDASAPPTGTSAVANGSAPSNGTSDPSNGSSGSTGGSNTSTGEDPSRPDETFRAGFVGSASGFYINSNNYPWISPIHILFGFDHEPSGPVFPMLLDPQKVLDDRYGPVTASRQADGTYSTYLIPKWPSEYGEYTGNFELKLCKDVRCASEYKVTGGTLPYKFEFRPDVTLTAKRNGTPVIDLNGFTKVTSGQTMQVIALTGATVEIESNMPVKWTIGGAGTSRTLAVISQTDRRIVGTVTDGPLTGSIDVRAQPIDTRYKYYSTVSILSM